MANIRLKSQEADKVEVSLVNFNRAKRSVGGRLSRLRYARYNRWTESAESPISEIGVFNDEINDMEKVLKSMEHRLDTASVFI